MVCAAAGIDVVAGTEPGHYMWCSTAIFLNIGVLAVDDDLDSFLAAKDVADDGFLALKLTAYAVA